MRTRLLKRAAKWAAARLARTRLIAHCLVFDHEPNLDLERCNTCVLNKFANRNFSERAA